MASESFKKLNPDLNALVGESVAKSNVDPANVEYDIKPSTDEANLNKTEKAYLAHLRRLSLPYVGIQNITIKLADDCRLTPDFVYINANGRLVLVDVKGYFEEDAKIKIKVAARLFPMFDFVVSFAKYTSVGGRKIITGWDEHPVKP